VVVGKSVSRRYAACVVLGTTRRDVCNASFASADEARVRSVDAAVMGRPAVVLDGGSRSLKILVAPGVLRALPGVEVVEGLAR